MTTGGISVLKCIAREANGTDDKDTLCCEVSWSWKGARFPTSISDSQKTTDASTAGDIVSAEFRRHKHLYAYGRTWIRTGRLREARPSLTGQYSRKEPMVSFVIAISDQCCYLEYSKQVVLKGIRIVRRRICAYRVYMDPHQVHCRRPREGLRTIPEHLNQQSYAQVHITKLLRAFVPLRQQWVKKRLPALSSVRLRDALEESGHNGRQYQCSKDEACRRSAD